MNLSLYFNFNFNFLFRFEIIENKQEVKIKMSKFFEGKSNAELQALFKTLDQNNDGYLSKE